MSENKRCGAKHRNREGICGLPAGWGTDHVGEGRCKHHGGLTPRGAASPHFKSGMYSQYVDPGQLVGFGEWEAEVGPAFNLERRLLGIMFILEQWVYHGAAMTKEGVEIPLEPTAVAAMLNAITRTYQAITKRHEGETIYIKFTPEIERAFAAIGDAIGEHVSDPAEADAVVAAIGEALEGLNTQS